jgi:uncharacterized ion transporter superfamily protein YfcC
MAFILYLMALAAPYTMSVFGWNGEQMASLFFPIEVSIIALIVALVRKDMAKL